MSRPDRPTMRDYMDWSESQNFVVTVTEVGCGEQRLISITIAASFGARLIELAEVLADPLMSTSIARMDRRLATKSYLFQ